MRCLVENMGQLISSSSGNIINVIHNINDLEKPFSNKIFLIETIVAGTSYVQNIKELEPQITIGKKLKFLREPKNEYDEKAILILNDDKKIGYIPREKNEILSRLMDAGKLLYGEVYQKEYIGNWLRIIIKVYLDD